MLQVGTLSHRAKSGRLVVRLSREVNPGSTLLSEDGKGLGRVVELIGPVRAPYASLEPSNDRQGKKGDPVFLKG